jgi:16S rRNA (guanine966-N2)-methyltransferase
MTRKAPNQIRIIGGEWRSRIIEFPDHTGLRPTPDRVRETLFNWLGQHLGGKTCLDLFAGSGALSFEALSRGAANVTMIEQSSGIVQHLKDSAQHLDAGGASIFNANALDYLRGAAQRFDVIFLDPPFNQGVLEKVLPLLPPWLSDEGKVYVESELSFAPGAAWKILKQSRAGQVKFQLMTPASVEET